jgi:hypothetical protein
MSTTTTTPKRPRYIADGSIVRDTQAEPGQQVLAVLADHFNASMAAQALNRGLAESIDTQGRWEDEP